MSVYTHLTLQQVQPLLHLLGVSEARALQPIKGGIENSNFFVTLADGQEFVLTLFEELSADQAAFLGPLLAHLQRCHIPVAAPFRDARQEWLHTLEGKPAQLAPRLRGGHPLHPSLLQCEAMGSALAKLHVAMKGYPLERAHAHGSAWWAGVAAEWRQKLQPDDVALLDEVLVQYTLVAQDPALSTGLIHGDLFRDNVLFSGNEVSAILDFSECSEDHLLLDIAVTANDFCRKWPSDIPDAERLGIFLQAYQRVLPLNDKEKNALPVFLAVAAMRFWLSRLEVAARNASEQRQGDNILQKNPGEMRDLLRARLETMVNRS